MRRTKPFLPILFGILIILFFAASSAFAQFRATVQGVVTDTSGATVSGATVTLTSKETSKTQAATTSDAGFYSFTGLAPGLYSVTVEQQGFKRLVKDNVTVS